MNIEKVKVVPKCPACLKKVSIEEIKCLNCKTILNPNFYEKIPIQLTWYSKQIDSLLNQIFCPPEARGK